MEFDFIEIKRLPTEEKVIRDDVIPHLAKAQSDPRVVVSPRFMSVMRRADDGADARVEARDPMGAPRGVSLMFNERRTPAAERQREGRMDPRAFSD